jgi:hypothetical protein
MIRTRRMMRHCGVCSCAQAGKFSVAYMELATEKEFYLAAACEEVGSLGR